MTHFGDYQFLTTNLLTKKVINEVELSSLHWTELYNKPGGGRATARIHHPKTTSENFNSWNNGLWVLKDGDIRWGGIIGPVQPRAGSGVIDIPILGFMDYLKSRVVKDISGMTNAALSVNDITWTQKDQFLIAADVVNHTQQGDGNIGLTVVYDALSGLLRDETIHTYQHKFAGEWFEQFAARINGFGWFPEFYYSGSNPQCRFKLVYPRAGRSTSFELVYEQGSTSNIIAYDLDGGQRPITGRLHLTGAGEGDDMVHTHIDGTASGVDYDAVLSFKDVTQASTLLEKGNYHMQTHNTAKRQFTIEIDWEHDSEPHYTEFRPGDEMTVKIDDGYVQVNSVCTIASKQVVLSPEHDEQVKVGALEVALL